MIAPDSRDYQYQLTTGSNSEFRATDSRSPSNTSCCSSNKGFSCCGAVSTFLSSAGVCFLVLGYTLLGAVTFMTLEGQEVQRSNEELGQDKLRLKTVEKLWSITEDLNILYKDNWTRLAEQEVLRFQDCLVKKYISTPAGKHNNHVWSFPSSFLYSLTLITTIGYGSISPRTPWGRIVTIVYALIGIPLMLVYLSTVGDTMARHFRKFYSKLSRNSTPPEKSPKQDPALSKSVIANHIHADQKIGQNERYQHDEKLCSINGGHSNHYNELYRQRVPLLITLSIVLGYISGGAFLFNKLENWTFLEGSYFCFTSLGTIGFGELIPGSAESGEELSIFVSSAYILIGMAIIAMCFNLVQDETVLLVRKLSLWMRKEDKVGEDESESIAMSVVSS
uniref:Potassium channel domain-containing protein n=1 Tax=Clastoptera arizonana TaxID=38151 RepID=A0A1B6BXP2_9HEMI